MANIPLKSLEFPGLDDVYTIPQITNLAPAFNSQTVYHVGDLVTYDNDLYECTVDTLSGEDFSTSKWRKANVKGVVDAVKSDTEKAVRYDIAQSLNDTQKTTARGNIGAASQTDLSNLKAVRYDTTQTLTDPQKSTARANIGAASQTDLSNLKAVRYDAAQTLTDAQKKTARDNIGAGEVDDTLTQSGQAADAKKVGDELTDLKDDLSEILEQGILSHFAVDSEGYVCQKVEVA